MEAKDKDLVFLVGTAVVSSNAALRGESAQVSPDVLDDLTIHL